MSPTRSRWCARRAGCCVPAGCVRLLARRATLGLGRLHPPAPVHAQELPTALRRSGLRDPAPWLRVGHAGRRHPVGLHAAQAASANVRVSRADAISPAKRLATRAPRDRLSGLDPRACRGPDAHWRSNRSALLVRDPPRHTGGGAQDRRSGQRVLRECSPHREGQRGAQRFQRPPACSTRTTSGRRYPTASPPARECRSPHTAIRNRRSWRAGIGRPAPGRARTRAFARARDVPRRRRT